MLDENLEVSPGGYLALGALAISPDGRLLAFSTDLTGDERYTLRCRDLASGEDVGPAIPQVLDRGMVWAIAHVRGGGEMGKRWHEAGRLTSKINTFTDYVTCARYLIDIGWTSADRLIGQGGSAGGMLMGWVANHAPEVFRGLVLHVPFVDVLNTILDTSLPLTTTEWEEWGEPTTDREAYQLIKSYSPYENVAQVPHPASLAVSSVNDARVSFVEATKWVSRLRDRTVDSREILLRTDMGGGHHGPSNRDANWQEYAYYYAWLLDLVAASNPACAVPELAHGF